MKPLPHKQKQHQVKVTEFSTYSPILTSPK